MPTERRPHPYIWPSWLCGLISGDKQCEWSAWFKAHFTYDKRPDEGQNTLSVYKAKHNALLLKTVERLRSGGAVDGAVVTVEDQNKFYLKGRAAGVGGKPDIVVIATAKSAAQDADTKSVVIADCKSGHPKDADFWQVVTYMVLWPKVHPEVAGLPMFGVVVYPDSERRILGSEAAASEDVVIGKIKWLAATPEPKTTPSPSECRFCDIACCKDRASDERAPVETDKF